MGFSEAAPLFLLQGSCIAKDMRPILSSFVPKRRPFRISSSEEIPTTMPDPAEVDSDYPVEDPETVSVRQRLTASVAIRN